jgi:plasmid stability protein
MARFVLRNLERDLQDALERRAASHECSMEEAVRRILRRDLLQQPVALRGLGSRVAARLIDAGLDGPLPEVKGQEIDPIDFSG